MSRIRPGRSRVAVATAALVSGAVLAVVPPGPSHAADGWGPVEDVSATTVDVYSDYRPPAIVEVRRNGTAVAAWVTGSYETPGPVVVSGRGDGGGWTAPQALSPVLPEVATYDLAVAGTDLASVVWQRKVGATWTIEESHLDGGAWSAPAQVGTGREPQVTVDGAGVTTVAWNDRGLRVAQRSEGGSWSEPAKLGSRAPWLVELASNADGDVALAWTDASRRVRAAVRPQGRKSWARAATLGKGPYVTSLRLAVATSGRALVLWSVTGVWNEPEHEYENYVAWARSTPRGQWSPRRVLTRALGEDGGGLDLSLNRRGLGVATWLQIHRSDSPAYLWAARFGRDGTWTAPARVTGKRVSWEEPRAWLDRTGAAHAIVTRGGSIWAYSQRPGAGWTGTQVGSGSLLDAMGTGSRLVVLSYRGGVLQSRLLDVS